MALLAQSAAAAVLQLGTNLFEGFLPAGRLSAPVDPAHLRRADRKVRRHVLYRNIVYSQQRQILEERPAFCGERQQFPVEIFCHIVLYIPWVLNYPVTKLKAPRPMAFLIFVTAALLLLIPTDALAWGIGVHLQIGSHILSNLQLLPAALQDLLGANPNDYLYGCISADITLGKKFTHYLNHCHSWRMGRMILDTARTDSQRACAYGYLGHLAADTVAHSYFVPFKLIRTFNTALLKHTYWEMRFEAQVDPEIWALARTIARKDFQENDAMMRGVLSDTIFSFATNKRLFNSLLLLSRLQQWRKMLRSLSTNSKWVLEPWEQEEYLELAKEASLSILTDMEESPYWSADPTGERAIASARMIRKNLNLLWLDGKLPEGEARDILAELRPAFREGIPQPDRLLELLSLF